MTKSRESKRRPANQISGVILLGLDDETGKPRAARFSDEQASAAKQAAKAMGLVVIPISDEVIELAKKIPAGRINGSGAVTVAPVSMKILRKLASLAAIDIPGLADPVVGDAVIPEKRLPRDWASVAAGDMVLAPARADVGGYWEALVLSRTNDLLTLAWAGWPSEPTFVLGISGCALMYPPPASDGSTGGETPTEATTSGGGHRLNGSVT